MRHRLPSRVIGSTVAIALLVAGCEDGSVDATGSTSDDVEVADEQHTAEDDLQGTDDGGDGGGAASDEVGRPPHVVAEVRAGHLVVMDAAGAPIASHPPSEEGGAALHAAVRPEDGHDTATVLALYRVEHPELGARYELRYLTVDEQGVTELFWFPWRMQIDARVAEVRDVPPIPVWSPDGSAVAWVEWDDDGTSLRVIGWRDSGESSNPSEAAASYRLDDVPAGTQLEAWTEQDGVPVFTATSPEGQVFEIELAVGKLAMGRRDA